MAEEGFLAACSAAATGADHLVGLDPEVVGGRKPQFVRSRAAPKFRGDDTAGQAGAERLVGGAHVHAYPEVTGKATDGAL